MIRKAQDAIELWHELNQHDDLTPNQFVYLLCFAASGGAKVKTVASTMRSTYNQTSTFLQKLKEKGYLEHSDPGYFFVTRKGMEVIKNTFPFTYS